MKRKLKLSVCDLMSRATSPKGTPHARLGGANCSTPHPGSIRFEDLYKQAIARDKIEIVSGHEAKKITTKDSNGPKKSLMTKSTTTKNSVVTSLANSRKKQNYIESNVQNS